MTARHVVERCPSCGVEHDDRADECDACGGALRYWCRVHGREAGWLHGPACPRCAEEAARRGRVPCPAPALPVTMPAAPRPRRRAKVRARTRGGPVPFIVDAPAVPGAPEVAPAIAPSPAVAPSLEVAPSPAGVPAKADAPPPLPVRIGIAVITTLLSWFGGWLVGMAGGALYAVFAAATVQQAAPAWGKAIGIVGLVLGWISAFFYVIHPSVPPKK